MKVALGQSQKQYKNLSHPLLSRLVKQARTYLSNKEVMRIQEAFFLADRLHQGQKRKSGEGYIHHPCSVAELLLSWRLDGDSVVAAILHDTLEDTALQKSDILSRFGPSVLLIVDGVTKIKLFPKSKEKEPSHSPSLHKLILALSKDVRVLVVKVADRLHNLQTLMALSFEKRRRIASETQAVYVPLAYRLGFEKLASELSELSFQHSHPLRYRTIKKHIDGLLEQSKEQLQMIQKVIRATLNQSNIPFSFEYRNKTVSSTYFKLVRLRKNNASKKRKTSLQDIMDLHAFRIIVPSVSDCYRILGIMHNLYHPIPGRFKDYIALPKPNGYQSLHTILLPEGAGSIEIQIRTQSMHDYLAHGVASHASYKTGGLPSQKWLGKLTNFTREGTLGIFGAPSLQSEPPKDEVLVLTPDGDLYTLPQGATALDLAYAIHSDIGNHASSAVIDNIPASIATPLQDGQTIQIITNPKLKPKVLRLEKAITKRALSSIHQSLKQHGKVSKPAMGRQMLRTSFRLFSSTSTFEKVETELKKRLVLYGLSSLDDLYLQIAKKERSAILILKDFFHSSNKALRFKTLAIGEQEPLGFQFQLASCCMPIWGDEIIAVPNQKNQTLWIHRTRCINHRGWINRQEDYVDVVWSEKGVGFVKSVLVIHTPLWSHTPEAIPSITSIVKELGGEPQEWQIISIEPHQKEIRLLLASQGRVHLNTIIRTLWRQLNCTRVFRLPPQNKGWSLEHTH